MFIMEGLLGLRPLFFQAATTGTDEVVRLSTSFSCTQKSTSSRCQSSISIYRLVRRVGVLLLDGVIGAAASPSFFLFTRDGVAGYAARCLTGVFFAGEAGTARSSFVDPGRHRRGEASTVCSNISKRELLILLAGGAAATPTAVDRPRTRVGVCGNNFNNSSSPSSSLLHFSFFVGSGEERSTICYCWGGKEKKRRQVNKESEKKQMEQN